MKLNDDSGKFREEITRYAVLKILNWFAVLGSLAWVVRNFDPNNIFASWKSLLPALGFFIALIGLEFKTLKNWNTAEEKYQKTLNEADKKLYSEFIETVPSDGIIKFIKRNSIAIGFKRGKLQDLRNFDENWRDAEHEFIDDELERKKKDLLELVEDYFEIIGGNMVTDVNTDGTPEVKLVEKYKLNPPEHQKIMKKLDSQSDKIVDKHQELIRIAKNKLGV